ncbi:MAG: hypothetical protein ACOCV8_02400 [Spirochaetota bacterium]
MNREIIEDLKRKVNLYNYKREQLAQAVEDKKTLQDATTKIEDSADKIENLIFTCKLILEKITYTSKIKLENFLTQALQNIFIDRNYELKLILKEDTKRPGLELTLSENGVDQEITDAVGGGIISTLGLLLQIYYIEVYKLNKIMFIDEGLKEVSTGINSEGESVNYLENLLAFLKWLAEEKKYSLIIITHDNTVKKYANKIYSVEKGKVQLCS